MSLSVARPRRIVLAMTLATLLGACRHEPTGLLEPDAEIVASAGRFVAIADSLDRAGTDRTITRAYVGIARAIRRHERASHIRIVVDGTESEWIAFAREIAPPTMRCPAGAVCAPSIGPLPLLSVIAWQRDDPRRVVQLTGQAGIMSFGVQRTALVTGPYSGGATLTYLDGTGGVYTASSGTGSMDATYTDRPCTPAPPEPIIAVIVADPPFTCTVATMRTSITANVQRPVMLSPVGNRAAGTHTLRVASQEVAGARMELTTCGMCEYPSDLLPPVTLQGTLMLSSSLGITVDSVVTFSLHVSNPRGTPAEVQFPSAQQYDFVVRATDGTELWRWSADRTFAQSLTTRVLASGEQWTITERWHPAVHGTFAVSAMLTSSSHFAESQGIVVVP